MTRIMLILWMSCHSFLCGAQQYLVVERNDLQKNYKYKEGDEILLHLKGRKGLLKGDIRHFNDSILVMDSEGKILFSTIEDIVHERYIPRLLRGIGFKGAIGVLLFPAANNLIQHDYPIFESWALIAAASGLGMGVAASRLMHKRCHVPSHWRIKVLDFSKFDK